MTSMRVGDFNTPLSEMDRSSRQKVHKDVGELNSTINQLDIMDIYTVLHPTTAQYTFFSSSFGTVPKIDHFGAIKHTLTNVKE